jgi:hypothetical protein
MDSTTKDNTSWFKNIKKNDDGANVDIIPFTDSNIENNVIKSSSTYDNNTVMNVTDVTPQTKWVSSSSSYSRGKILDDANNKSIINNNQRKKDALQNDIQILKRILNHLIDNANRKKRRAGRNNFWEVYYWNRDLDRDIARTNSYYNSKINVIRTKLNNISNINDLPLNITNDGKYIGNKQTTLTNNSVINGEWIDVKVPNTIIVKEYELLPGRKDNNPEQLTPFPKDFYLLGSNDTNKWEIIDSHFDYTPSYSDNNTPITFNIDNKKKYTSIRLVISSINTAYTTFKGLGAVSLSMFNLSGTRCYSLNKSSCETFQSYINNKNMSTIEGLTMMDENLNVLADLKDFNEKYSRYIKCHDITLSDNIKQDCTSEDSIDSVNNAYSKLMENGSIQSLQNTPLNQYSTVAEYETKKRDLLKTHSEIIPLRQELDHKLKILTDDKKSFLADYSTNYDNTMYTSLGLSVVLTSTLYFVFKQL